MLLKKNNKNNPIVIALILTIFLVVLTLRSFSIYQAKADFSEYFLSLNLGYSRVPSLDKFTNDFINIVVDNFFGGVNKPSFDLIYIDVNPEEYRTILSDRKRALSNNVLVDPKEVKAKIRFNGEEHSANIRLKGDLSDHWLSKRRMSLRIKIKNDASILGFNEFSIQKPASRQHPYDSVFQSVVKKTGNLASSHEYVNVIFNGTDWGVMNMEEAMSVEFLEKERRKDSIIIRFSSEEKGAQELKNFESGVPLYNEYRLSDDRLYMKMYEERKYAENLNARKWYSYIAQERINNNKLDSQIYNIDSYSQVLILSSFWNDGHALWHANSRHYFNPYTLRLEPITTDSIFVVPILPEGLIYPRKIFNPLLNNSIYNSILAKNEFKLNFNKNFNIAIEAAATTENEYDYFQNIFPLDIYEEKFMENLNKNIEIISHKVTQELVFASRPMLKDEAISAPTEDQLLFITDHVHIRHFENGDVSLFNLLPVPVKINKITLDQSKELNVNKILPAYEEDKYQAMTFSTSYKGLLDYRLQVETEYKGKVQTTSSGITLLNDKLYNPLLINNQEGFPFLKKAEGRGWEVISGIWNITRPIVIDGDLTIPANTRLQFAEDAYLIVKGSMHALGKQNQPIDFVPLENSWKGIYVLGENNSSSLKFVNFESYSSLEDGLLSLSGGITFYRSNLLLEDVSLRNSLGEDALNIIESDFQIERLNVNETVSDAVDSDFSNGSIIDSKFSNVNGDAVDFSGSTVTLANIVAENVFDKAISVGEASVINIDGGDFTNIGVGVVSKDGSSTTANNVAIKDYELAAAMSYTKKSFYTEPYFKLSNIQVVGENPFVRQIGSFMSVDGIVVEAQSVDVDNLYENTVMRK